MFCPKCGNDLKEMSTGFDFEFGFYTVVVYACETCEEASIIGKDELGLRKAISNVKVARQDGRQRGGG